MSGNETVSKSNNNLTIPTQDGQNSVYQVNSNLGKARKLIKSQSVVRFDQSHK